MLCYGGPKHKLDYQLLFVKGARDGSEKSSQPETQSRCVYRCKVNCFFKLTLLVHKEIFAGGIVTKS